MEIIGGQGLPPLRQEGIGYLKILNIWHKTRTYEMGVTDPIRFRFHNLETSVRSTWVDLIFPEDDLTFWYEPEPSPDTQQRIQISNDQDVLMMMNLPQVSFKIRVFACLSNDGIRTRLLIQEDRFKQLEHAVYREPQAQNPPAVGAAQVGVPPEFPGQNQ